MTRKGSNLYGAVILYLCSNGKKIFAILCAFILGTLIGSSFPLYYPQSTIPCSSTAKVQLNDIGEAEVTFRAHNVSLANDIKDSRKNVSLKSKKPISAVSDVELHYNGEEVVTEGDQKSTFTENEVKTAASRTVATKEISKLTSVAKQTKSASHVQDSPDPKYFVNTPVCNIPRFDPWDKSVLHALQRLDMLDCGNHPLANVIGDMLLLNESNLAHYGIEDRSQVRCCYSELVLSNSKIEATVSEKCTYFSKQAQLKEEFIRVQCNTTNKTTIYTDFFYTVPLKPEVESRCSKMIAENQKKSKAFTAKGKQEESLRHSIMILGLDATSRLNFERYLPKTRNYILNQLHGVEMMGYNKVGDNTFPNVVPLLSGLNEDELKAECWSGGNGQPLDSCPWIWKRAAKLGYRTIYGEDSPHIDTFHYVKKGFVAQPTDYYMRPLLVQLVDEIGNKKDGNVLLCLGQRPQYQVSTSWAFHLMERFSGVPYFGLIWSNSLTHDYPNNLQHADDYLHGALRDLHEDGHLNNTFLFINSDHGARWGALRETPIGRYEEHLPALYIIPPLSFRSSRPAEFASLVTNSRRLTTNFDLHVTFKEILALSQPNEQMAREVLRGSANDSGSIPGITRGLSLFEPVPINRTCQHAGIDQHWCACDESVTVDPTDPVVVSAAARVVKKVNKLTSHLRKLCSRFEVARVVSALRETTVQGRERGQEVTPVYHVVVLVKPGDALFEGTVLSDGNGTDQHVQGPISRLSLYGNQSACVEQREMKIYCFCLLGARTAISAGYLTSSTIEGIDPR